MNEDMARKELRLDERRNAVERKPVETRVLNLSASEASYKPKQRSYRKTNLKNKVLVPDSPGAEMSGAEISSAETAVSKRTRPVGGCETRRFVWNSSIRRELSRCRGLCCYGRPVGESDQTEPKLKPF